MGDGCLNRNLSPMFDGAVTDPDKRYWYDATYFVQYLVDGMRELSRFTGNNAYRQEANREATYCLSYLKDKDGLYWRNMRLWTIDSTRTQAFYALTGAKSPTITADESERSSEPLELAKPIETRRMTKTLLANAGVSRMFWLLSH